MKFIDRITVARAARPLTLGLAIFASAGSIAVAQTPPGPITPGLPPAPMAPAPNSAPNAAWGAFDPQYDSVTNWNQSWDGGTYDRRHVLVGTVAEAKPFRVMLLPIDPDGHATSVDLKNGTVIRPEGTTLTPGMRVAIFGYWSKGTFIANHVILRQS